MRTKILPPIYLRKSNRFKKFKFRKTYDIFSTPQVYLVNQNKEIIGKQLDALTVQNDGAFRECETRLFTHTEEELKRSRKKEKTRKSKRKLIWSNTCNS